MVRTLVDVLQPPKKKQNPDDDKGEATKAANAFQGGRMERGSKGPFAHRTPYLCDLLLVLALYLISIPS